MTHTFVPRRGAGWLGWGLALGGTGLALLVGAVAVAALFPDDGWSTSGSDWGTGLLAAGLVLALAGAGMTAAGTYLLLTTQQAVVPAASAEVSVEG